MRNNEELKQYFDKYIFEVFTILKDGIIKCNVKKVKVYNPFDFTKRVTPANGSDIVINDYSTDSDYIYDLKKGIHKDLGFFTLHRYGEKSLSTYCEENQIKEIKTLHLESIKNSVKELVLKLEEEVKTLNKIKL